MNSSYYKQKLFVAKVTEKDELISEVERWEAHEKGILHRGFTAILAYDNKYILQHRKHIAFDNVWDLTFSSHQLFQNHRLENDNKAIYHALIREWNLKNEEIKSEPKYLGKVYYRAKDPNSIFTEHEFDYIYLIKINNIPSPNKNFAYGISIKNSIAEIKKTKNLAPWVVEIINQITPNISLR